MRHERALRILLATSQDGVPLHTRDEGAEVQSALDEVASNSRSALPAGVGGVAGVVQPSDELGGHRGVCLPDTARRVIKRIVYPRFLS